ncbi:MAG: hypothetical protein K6G76_04865, partial [Lachnospiraceae bacterium]|nr:hypothetical protein [Lachnospiraceae bacterium]
MYKRNAQGWSKHLDFMVLDIIVLQLSYVFAYFIRMRMWDVYVNHEYRNLGILLFIADVLMIVLNNSLHDVIKRSVLREAFEHIKHSVLVLAVVLIYFFSSQLGDIYSRIVLGLTFVFYILFGFSTRIIWKSFLKTTSLRREKNNMLVVVTEDTAEMILSRLLSDKQAGYQIVGVVLLETTNLKTVCGVPVVTDIKNAAKYIAKEWIDSVYIDGPINDKRIVKLMDACAVMAVPTHYHVPYMSRS